MMEAQNKTLGNAIKRLSAELYSKDVQFTMELIQVGAGGRTDCKAVLLLLTAEDMVQAFMQAPPC